ncbi:hypothetical protein F4859DRAFT_482488 [Xylaria cf. heliscus]|nr:hypothetical protein F4859DRAFT_482488 [Xylaria cf. heliscus]
MFPVPHECIFVPVEASKWDSGLLLSTLIDSFAANIISVNFGYTYQHDNLQRQLLFLRLLLYEIHIDGSTSFHKRVNSEPVRELVESYTLLFVVYVFILSNILGIP